MRYTQINLSQTITEISNIAESEPDADRRNIFYSARDYLQMFQFDTENKAVAWETILECKKQKKGKK